MAYSPGQYPNQTGSTTDYTIPFEYIGRADVKVEVNGDPVGFSFVSDYVIRLDEAPVGYLKIFRETQTEPIAVYTDTSVLLSEDLNVSNDQALYLAEESFATAKEALDGVETGLILAGQFGDVLTAVEASETAKVGSEEARDAAQVAKDASENARDAAVDAKTGAETAQTSAVNQANAAAASAAAAENSRQQTIPASLVYNSLASLNANLVPADGVGAVVNGDATAGNNGLYRKTGATGAGSWTFIGPLVSSTVFNSVAPSTFYLGDKPVIYDWNGVYGQVRTLYFNRSFFSRTVKGTATVTIGTESVRIPGFTEVQVPGTSTLYKVLINRLTGVISIPAQNALPALSDDDLLLFDVRGQIISNERYPVQLVENGNGMVHPFSAIVVEDQADGSAGATILVPRLQWASGAYTTTVPAASDGSMFVKEVTGFAPGATPQLLVFDQIATAGADTVKVLSAPRFPDSKVMKTFAWGYAGQYGSDYPMLGRVPGGSVPNQSNLGKNNVDAAEVLFGETVKTTIANATANALGFTHGVKAANGNALYGSLLSDTTPGRWVTARFFLLSDLDDDFPLARAYFTTPSGAGNLQILSANILMEKRHSARVRSYVVRAQVPTGGPYVGLQVGVLATGRDITVFGLQHHSGGSAASWIMRNDYPEGTSADAKISTAIKLAGSRVQGKLVYPPKMFLIQGRKRKLYANAIVEDRTDGQDAWVTLDARGPAANGQWPQPTTGKGEIIVDPADVASTGRVVLRTASQASLDARYLRDIDIKVAPSGSLSGTSASALFLGDSLVEFTGLVQATVRELAACGMTLTPIGTVETKEQDQSNGGDNPMLGEGRGSRKSTNYTYQAGVDAVTPCDPFADAFIPSYQALSTTDKRAYNPFLRAATGGDNPDWVQNGYIFDPAFYRTRFGLVIPKYVLICLGTNDITQIGLPTGTAALTLAMQIMVGQIRAAWPTTYIGLMVPPLPRSAYSDPRWASQVLLYRALQGVVNDANSTYVELVPAFAHASSEVGWAFTSTAIDTVTGSQTAAVGDNLHFRGATKEQVGRSIADWIACKQTGA